MRIPNFHIYQPFIFLKLDAELSGIKLNIFTSPLKLATIGILAEK